MLRFIIEQTVSSAEKAEDEFNKKKYKGAGPAGIVLSSVELSGWIHMHVRINDKLNWAHRPGGLGSFRTKMPKFFSGQKRGVSGNWYQTGLSRESILTDDSKESF